MNCNYLLIWGMYLCLNTDCRETVALKQAVTFISCRPGAKFWGYFGQCYSLIYASHFPLSMNERWGWTHMLADSFKHIGNSRVITPNFCELHPNNNETVRSTEVNSIYIFFSFKYCYSALSLGYSTVEACTPPLGAMERAALGLFWGLRLYHLASSWAAASILEWQQSSHIQLMPLDKHK